MRRGGSVRTASFCTLGCKLNQAETNSIQNQFRRRGYSVVPFGAEADVTVVNTCTVTNRADSKSRHAVRSAVKASPEGRTVVTGCYSQIQPEEVKAIEGVNLILGTTGKHRIFDYLDQYEQEGSSPERSQWSPVVFVHDCSKLDQYDESTFGSSTFRTRAFLKIQEGCNYYCSYCVIPFARGKARSRNFKNAVEEAKRLVDEGFKEIVLTGINIGTYEFKNSRVYRLHDLLASLTEVSGLERIRVSSIEPNTITNELLYLVREHANICAHLHVPLQSGSDRMLKTMQRRYCIEKYLQVIEQAQRLTPVIALGSDIIVGHPGETEEDFRKTVDLVRKLPFAYLHIFRYSPRPGTVAAQMEDQVDEDTKRKRSAILREISAKKRVEYARRFVGQVLPILFESKNHEGDYVGFSPNYIRVSVPANGCRGLGLDLYNKIRMVRLDKIVGRGAKGVLAD